VELSIIKRTRSDGQCPSTEIADSRGRECRKYAVSSINSSRIVGVRGEIDRLIHKYYSSSLYSLCLDSGTKYLRNFKKLTYYYHHSII
jgi:hypothetical protein